MKNGSGAGMRLGRTIVGAREKTESESERIRARKKQKNKRLLTGGMVVVGLLVVGGAIVLGCMKWFEEIKNPEVEEEKFVPTVEIVDERGGRKITERVKSYVGMVECDFKDLGYKVSRVVLPEDKMREVDVYLDGRTEYYKLNLDRMTGVSVEDAVRMLKYLDKEEVKVEYVDVRVEGRGYYK